MSIPREIVVECPSCAHEQLATIWAAVNYPNDPPLRERILTGEINTVECARCGERATVLAALLYHDMDREYCVQFYPPSAIDDDELYAGLTADGSHTRFGLSRRMALEAGYLLEPHVVFSMEEMARYIRFRERLHELGGQRGSCATPSD